MEALVDGGGTLRWRHSKKIGRKHSIMEALLIEARHSQMHQQTETEALTD